MGGTFKRSGRHRRTWSLWVAMTEPVSRSPARFGGSAPNVRVYDKKVAIDVIERIVALRLLVPRRGEGFAESSGVLTR